jgi:putative ribosome biogenesis GTPase RsgA
LSSSASQLAVLGWDPDFEAKFKSMAEAGSVPARVIADFGVECLVHDGERVMRAATGRHVRNDGLTQPAVGDWVALVKREPAGVIHGIVERRTTFSRKVASAETRE